MIASKPVPDADEQDVEESMQKQIDFWPSGRKVLNIQDCDFFYDIDLSTIQVLKAKHTGAEGLVPHKNIFREMKKQNPRQKLQCIPIRLHQGHLLLLPPHLLSSSASSASSTTPETTRPAPPPAPLPI